MGDRKPDGKPNRVPLTVANALSRLATTHGTDAVLEATRDWLHYIERQKDLIARYQMGEPPVRVDPPPAIERMTTYKRADGELIGEYGWVTDLDWFDNDDGIWEPIELVEEVWWRESTRSLTYTPPGWTPHEDDEDEDDEDEEVEIRVIPEVRIDDRLDEERNDVPADR
jgi:hypothetical protein